MVEHDKIITHLSKQEVRRMNYLTTEIARTLFIPEAEVDIGMVRELRALQLKKAGITEPTTGANNEKDAEDKRIPVG